MTSDLSKLLQAGSFLVESTLSKGYADLQAVLHARLSQYHQCLASEDTSANLSSLEDLEQATALGALNVLEGVQRIIGVDGNSADLPAIGTRDLSQLRTLLSIVFKWGVVPLVTCLKSAWPSSKLPQPSGPSAIVDVSNLDAQYSLLSSITTRLMTLLFPTGPRSPLPQTLITTTVLNRHVGDIIGPSIILGWSPKSLHLDPSVAVDALRPLTMRLLAILPPSQTIVALVGVLSAHRDLPHARKTCIYLLGRQLLRPYGVRGLFAALLGEDESADADVELEKLEHITSVVSTVPANLSSQEFFDNVVPQLLAMLQEDKLSSYQRAASFAISRLLDNPVASKSILPSLHKPLLVPTSETPNRNQTPDGSLSTLLSLILNSDPSPTLISSLISPVFVSLYSLLFHLETVKTSDPELIQSIRGLLTTWGRIVSQEEGLSILWYMIHCASPPGWRVDTEGHIARLQSSEKSNEPDFLMPEDRATLEEVDESTNILNLFPDPSHLVRFLKTIDRSDISSELFVKLLEAYRDSKSSDEDPLKTLLYLQLVMQLQSQLTQGSSSSGILAKPSHVLAFVKHALESAASIGAKLRTTKPEPKGFGLQDLKIVEESDAAEGDSDDEDPDMVPTAPDEEITETAINLLLSILEVHEDLSAQSEPILNDISVLLEALALSNASHTVTSLARECRMVLTARLASASSGATSRSKQTKEEEDTQAIYQKALKLLQDPILPVRAHGLLLLRQLVQASSTPQRQLDPAFMPAISSIFLQSVQDNDSYIFLNAVQGLSAMVDTYGNEVLKNLVQIYTVGLDGLAASNLTQQDVDTRTRVGEALGQVIRRCGEALGLYVDILVPPIFNVFRSSHLPTALRTSALSLLAECENTYPFALIQYSVDLSEAMIDLLQVEGTANTQKKSAREGTKEGEETGSSTSAMKPVPTMDDQPTTTNSKLPPLRRAALHFLSILARSATKQIYDTSASGQPFPPRLIQRARTTLSYIAIVDEDAIVRVMAREAGEFFVQL